MPKIDENPLADFPGWDGPRYTQVPDALFDVVAPFLGDAELRVLLYIMRRTFGWKKDSDAISLSQITNGIVKRDGERLDYGARISRPSAVKALTGLAEKGLIIAQKRSSAERGNEATVYTLRMRGGPWLSNFTSQESNLTTPGKVALPGVVNAVYSQESLVQETDLQESGSDAEGSPLENDVPYSAWIAGTVLDYSRELGDAANGPAHVQHALLLWQRSGLRDAAFVELLHQAKIVARKKQGPGRNVMRQFFSALEDATK